MHNYIMTFGIVLFAVFTMVLTSNISTYARSTEYLKEDTEIAVHDASLQLDFEEFSEGRIVFDPDLALQAFKESFEINTGMQESDYEIVEFELFDHSNTTFPVTYTSVKTGFSDTFFYPTVLAMVKTTTNKYFFTPQEKEVLRVASYSYKLDTENPVQISSFNTVVDSEPDINGLHWVVPYTKNISSEFNPKRLHPIFKKVVPHKGIDIAEKGILDQPVVAAYDGVVTYANTMGGYGKIIEIDHGNGLVTRYAHLNDIFVQRGDHVRGGEVIGLVGNTGNSTGPHLHFETIVNGEHRDPMELFKNHFPMKQ